MSERIDVGDGCKRCPHGVVLESYSGCPQCDPPARDWKPVVGEKVLVEATVIRLRPERDGYLDVEIADHYYYADSGEVSDLEDPYRIRLPLSSIRPMDNSKGVSE